MPYLFPADSRECAASALDCQHGLLLLYCLLSVLLYVTVDARVCGCMDLFLAASCVIITV